MTNDTSLTPEQEGRLLESYRTLTDLARTCRTPAVLAALRGALAELRVALDGSGVELEDYYSHVPAAGARAA
ncbi:hypothetical protein HHX38_30465 [Streptomyces sp. PKU-MA01144]|uniref:DUF6052 family protein n=1 Tax=Streptomyces sp. PKU-MA01144 TaxID=2729138 RepID=UPI00147BED76|nr:DUF6052 family protein [Streptomyces sp. PKU-MA01144]NNJ08405.1 hypothetical protein [Streptomyces sp. PKU-MA01144]